LDSALTEPSQYLDEMEDFSHWYVRKPLILFGHNICFIHRYYTSIYEWGTTDCLSSCYQCC